MQLYQNNIQDKYGNAIAGASVRVVDATTSALAVLYSDNGVTPMLNPITVGGTGEFAFYAPNGRYTFTATSPGVQVETVLNFELADSLEIVAAVAGGAASAAADALTAETNAGLTALDRAATGADRVQTGQDRTAAAGSATTATTQAGIAATKAGEALASKDAAALSLATIDNRTYPAPSATDPPTRPDGSARQQGDRYYNSVSKSYKAFDGVDWFDPETTALNLRNSTETTAKSLRDATEVTARALRDNTEATALAARSATATANLATIATINNRGAWITATAYALRDIVLSGGTWYLCVVAHSSGASFDADAASKWRVYQGVTSADLVTVKVGVDSYRIGTQYASLDVTLVGVILVDGSSGYPNKVGINNAKPVTEPPSGARTVDTGYIAGDADLAAIVAGYDNVNNALAGVIAGYHCMIYSTATHGTILGGSLHAILPGADYATILGGTEHTIQNDCDYGVIVGGERNRLESGVSLPTDYGHRGAILGGFGNTVSGQFGTIVNGQLNTTTAIYAAIFGGNGCTVSGSYGVASGNTVTVSGSYSVAFGNGITVSGIRSFAHGDEHSVVTDYSTAWGYRCKPPFAGAQVHSARQRANVVGANQALEFTCSQETTDATLTSLSINGSTTYPNQPANSVVAGNWVVTGVDTATGNVCSYNIAMVSKRGAGTTPVISSGAAVVVIDEITVGAVPALNAVATGIYRLRVTGKAATSIVWSAVFRGLQIVYA